jgi:hypothetical protein
MYSYSTVAEHKISFTCRIFFDDNDWPIGAKIAKFDKEIDRESGAHFVWNVFRSAATNMATMRDFEVKPDNCKLYSNVSVNNNFTQ